MSEALELKAALIGLELQFHKHTGLWMCDDKIYTQSPYELERQKERGEKARAKRRTKLQMAEARAAEQAHAERLERE
eukprot:4132383-Amphidinium_carterae.1